MNYKNILVTGGAGFVGSNICIKLKNYFSNIDVFALDNLTRKGSKLNVPRLEKNGVKFMYGDVRNKKDLEIKDSDLIIECSAEPSVMAGVSSSPNYLVSTNLVGALNCFELARKTNCDIVFLSTSRVYPVHLLNNIKYKDGSTRFEILNSQNIDGVSKEGISEEFPLTGNRTLYGATKLSAEFVLMEYINNYGMKGIINRCGLITGPWQMGKVDQGIIALWMARHIFEKSLSFIGFGGEGKQVRDVLDIDDLFDLLAIQLSDVKKYSGHIFNVGGGKENSVSLLELTKFCQALSGNKVSISNDPKTRQGDIRIYISDNSKIRKLSSWKPKKTLEKTLDEVYKWIVDYKKELKPILS
ncbi:MAG: NAD-dependent epimerase/dehydratase family protein [Candidatus Levybacteria bacterium]|nr:NAD-dependent epimerase/dehydratase family protein [Candidatus Levybacteria bacterium]